MRKPNNPLLKIIEEFRKSLTLTNTEHNTDTITIYSQWNQTCPQNIQEGNRTKKTRKDKWAKATPGGVEEREQKDKKDEKIGLTKGEGFDIMAKLT